MEQTKHAFVEALPVITGLASGYGPGRNIAGETAAASAPKGRVQRSENIARNAAAIGVPLGGLGAMALAHKYRLAPRMADFAARHFPGGLISDPESERELIRQLLPGAAAIGGSLAGGAATGATVGGLQQLRGATHKTAAELEPAQEPQQTKKPARVEGAGRLAAGAVGLNTAAGFGTLGAGRLAAQNFAQEASMAGAPELYGRLRDAASVPVHDAPLTPGGFFIPGGEKTAPVLHRNWGVQGVSPEAALKPHVIMGSSKSPSVLAHELGHAGIDQNRLGRLVQNRATMRLGQLGGGLGFLGGLATGGSENETTRNVGMASGALASLPLLAFEAGASLKGYRNLKNLGASVEQLAAARKSLLPAFGTYAGQTAGALSSGMLGSSIGRALGNRSRRIEAAKEATVKAVEPEDAELGDENEPHTTKAAFNVNQYSGVMNPAPMQYASSVPGWQEPPVKTAGPPADQGKLKKEAANFTPLGQLGKSKAVGTLKASAPPGPSIAQISKPKGFGMPLSGAKKGNNTI